MNKAASTDQSFSDNLYKTIEDNLTNEQFGVEELAREIGISRSQLHRKLHDITGQSASQVIREYRLKKAGELLKNDKVTVAEVAYQVGFGSPSYFNTCFHEYFGYPPGEVKIRKSVEVKRKPLIKKSYSYFLIGILLCVLSVFIGLKIKKNREIKFALNHTLPALDAKIKELSIYEGKKNWEYYQQFLELKKILRSKPELTSLWNANTFPLTINTNPDGGKVYAKPYSNPDTSWYYLGKTPMFNVPFPKGLSRIKIEKPDYETQYDMVFDYRHEGETFSYQLFKKNEMPEGMVYVPNQMDKSFNKRGFQSMYLSDLGLPGLFISHFWIDRYEVTNAQYKTFLESARYDNPVYWNFPMIDGEDSIALDVAKKRFTDKTGWPGPANWELGDYPDGEEDVPVTGISWYEAAAFANFKEKELPTLFHWFSLAEHLAAPEIVKFGNYDKKGPASIKTYNSLTRFGTYDLPGNVSEWSYNTNMGDRFVLGGNYREPNYLYNSTFIRFSPWTRSELVGFRCIKYIDDTLKNQLKQNFHQVQRDYDHLIPVSDEIFQAYKEIIDFERIELNPRLVSRSETEDWIQEIISLDVPYEEGPMKILVFLPVNHKPPYQSILYFPGIGAHLSNSLDDMKVGSRFDFFLKSGRAVIWPAYYASYGRGTTNITNINLWEHAYRCILADVRITIDYLQSRNDMDSERIAFYGYSWGGAMAPYILALEDRIKTGILNLFGVSPFEKYRVKEFDQVDYLPHVNIPMLLLGGRYDSDFTQEQQQAFYDLLGTPEIDKKWRSYETTHYLPRTNLVNESLSWLDKYFGPVEN